MGILGLSVFWCMISLLAISRLEKRLPSEMQEQLEFHATFSGLWPRQQPGTLGARCAPVSSLSCPEAWNSLVEIIQYSILVKNTLGGQELGCDSMFSACKACIAGADSALYGGV